MISYGHRAVLFLMITTYCIGGICGTENPTARFKLKSQVNDIRAQSRESTARDGYDDGGYGGGGGGGDGLGTLLSIAALALSSLALLAALVGPLLTLGLNGMANNGFGNNVLGQGGFGGLGVQGNIPVVPAGRKRRSAMGEEQTQMRAEDILALLDSAIESYGYLDKKNMTEVVCDVKNGGMTTSGLSKITKQFLLIYKFLRNTEKGDFVDELKTKASSIVEAMSSPCK